MDKIQEIKKIMRDDDYDKLINHLINEINIRYLETTRVICPYSPNQIPQKCADNIDNICLLLPKEIIHIIFNNIPIKDRQLSFFKTNKYYYSFRDIFYRRYSCNFKQHYKNFFELSESITNNVKILHGINFVHNLQYFKNVVKLTFDKSFNQEIGNLILPPSLKILEFGHNFNKSVRNLKLPESLIVLKFGYCFNYPVSNLKLPGLLKYLEFGYRFEFCLTDTRMPDSLEYVLFSGTRKNRGLPDNFVLRTYGLYTKGYELPVKMFGISIDDIDKNIF